MLARPTGALVDVGAAGCAAIAGWATARIHARGVHASAAVGAAARAASSAGATRPARNAGACKPRHGVVRARTAVEARRRGAGWAGTGWPRKPGQAGTCESARVAGPAVGARWNAVDLRRASGPAPPRRAGAHIARSRRGRSTDTAIGTRVGHGAVVRRTRWAKVRGRTETKIAAAKGA